MTVRETLSAELQCYWGDESKREQTTANLPHGWKVRCNNEQNHIVFLGEHFGGHNLLRVNCIADSSYIGDINDSCSSLSVTCK